jgi:CcmD family protein
MRLIKKYFKSLILALGVLSCIYIGFSSISHIEANEFHIVENTGLAIVAFDGDTEEDDPFIKKSDELPYLFSAFFITWVVLFAYIFIIARNRKEIESELYTLKNSLEENNND